MGELTVWGRQWRGRLRATHLLNNRAQTARPCVTGLGATGNRADSAVGEGQVNTVGGEEGAVLLEESVPRLRHHVDHIRLGESEQLGEHGETADKLGQEAVRHQVGHLPAAGGHELKGVTDGRNRHGPLPVAAASR